MSAEVEEFQIGPKNSKMAKYFILKTKFYFTTVGERDTFHWINIPLQNGEVHKWKIDLKYRKEPSGIYNSFHKLLTITGQVVGETRYYDPVYEPSYCRINLLNDQLGIKGCKTVLMDAPSHNKFQLKDKVQFTAYQNGQIQYLSENLTFSLTFGSKNGVETQGPFRRVKDMLDNSVLTDVVIKTNERDFPCHRLILAAESDFFKVMFQTNMTEGNTCVVDWRCVFDGATVEDLLFYFYTCQTPPHIKETCWKLYEAARLCLLDNLATLCMDAFDDHMDVSNVIGIMEVAEKFDLQDLKETAMDYATMNFEEVTTSEAFKDLTPKTAKTFFTSFLGIRKRQIHKCL